MALMKCPDCGKEFSDTALACPNCGWRMGGKRSQDEDDTSDSGLNMLGFLVPIIGFFLFVAIYSRHPKKATIIGGWTLLGFIIWFVLYIIVYGIN